MRRKVLILAGVSVVALIVISVMNPSQYLIWNRTASSPQGLYWRNDGPLTLNGWAVVSAEAPAAKWIADHGYLASGWPIIKRIAGLPGDEICREDETISINGTQAAAALNADSLGQKLPVWSGCFTLQADEIFLLNDHPRSLDGRYFGTTKLENVTGSARLLFRTGEASA